MSKPNAQVRMKALVAARLLMGDFDDWNAFEMERDAASMILNRRAARSASKQIGRSYRDLSAETQGFISENFSRCEYADLANLCEAIPSGLGMHERLDDFEASFFPLAEQVKRRFPFHAHVSITLYGLQFEFPEHHFLRDLESAFIDLAETRSKITEVCEDVLVPKKLRSAVGKLVARDKFLSRSIISAAFSLVEAFLSGLFFAAVHTGLVGRLQCNENFSKYARSKESAALKGRLDKVVKFISEEQANGNDEPFRSFIELGKRYRDAIHHTTPFERRDIEAGGRLLMLYEIDSDVALKCALYSLETMLAISHWANGDANPTAVAMECQKLKDQALQLLEQK